MSNEKEINKAGFAWVLITSHSQLIWNEGSITVSFGKLKPNLGPIITIVIIGALACSLTILCVISVILWIVIYKRK